MTADQSPLSPPADAATLAALIRIADALERLAPPAVAASDIHAADGFIWDAVQSRLEPVPRINRVPDEFLRGAELHRPQLYAQPARFAPCQPAHNTPQSGATAWGSPSLETGIAER